MGSIGCPETSVTTNLRSITSQKNEDTITLLTAWCTVLIEKLTGLQLVKKFPAFQGTRRFITALTSVRHLSLSWASPIQSIYPHPTSWRSILMLSTHLRLGLPTTRFMNVIAVFSSFEPCGIALCFRLFFAYVFSV